MMRLLNDNHSSRPETGKITAVQVNFISNTILAISIKDRAGTGQGTCYHIAFWACPQLGNIHLNENNK